MADVSREDGGLSGRQAMRRYQLPKQLSVFDVQKSADKYQKRIYELIDAWRMDAADKATDDLLKIILFLDYFSIGFSRN